MVRRWRKRTKTRGQVINNSNHILYFGYGMNTNLESMARRCPGAESLGHATLQDYEFNFRTFADVSPKDASSVEGVLWHINKDHLNSLDALEGYPIMYNRAVMPIVYQGETVYAWVYYMESFTRWGPPSEGYVQTLREGYLAHGVPQSQINRALRYVKEDPMYEYYHQLETGPIWS